MMKNSLRFFLSIVFASLALVVVVPAQAQEYHQGDGYRRPVHHVYHRHHMSRHEMARRHEAARHEATHRSY
jgi:hypothetical protein